MSGTCIKDKWAKPKRVASRVGGGDGWGGGIGGGKMETIVLEQQQQKGFKKDKITLKLFLKIPTNVP